MQTNIVRGDFEKKLLADYPALVGVDEVGRGCIAGPVYAACVVLDYEQLFQLDPKNLKLIRDSKTLSAKQRAHIQPIILSIAKEAHVAAADVDEIDEHNILQATFLAMRRALDQCSLSEDALVLVDGSQTISSYDGEQRAVVDGDAVTYSIAAASILAKQARDTYMCRQSEKYPMYGFERHVGYGTQFHLQMLQLNGACPIHRKSFAPVARVLNHAVENS